MMTKFVIPAAIVLACLFGGYALLATSPKLEPSRPEPLATTVRVLDVRPQPVQLKVNSQGTVAPNIESELIPEVSGRVEWISPALVNGGYFEAGQVLLRLEDKDNRAKVERANAALTRSRAEHEHARYEYQRLKSLEDRRLASRSQMENALRAFRVSQATLQDAEVNFEQASRDLDRTEITAPFTGLVRREAVDIGQFVSRGSAIATLYATDQVEVRLPIADRQLAYLNVPVGARGELPLLQQPDVVLSAEYAGRQLSWRGKIVRTEAQIDTASRMVHVIARVTNEDQATPLSVGLFVKAEIEGLKVDDVVVLPRIAMRNDNQVLVVDEDNRLRFRDIDPLRLYQDDMFVRGGLVAGERVCVSPLQTAVDGMPVNPVAG